VSLQPETRTATLRFQSPEGDNYSLRVDQRIRSRDGLELTAAYTLAFTAVQDFSALVDVSYVATRSNRADGTLSFDVRVTNTAQYALRLPLLLVLDPSRYFGGTAQGTTTRPDGLWLIDLGAG